MTKKEQKVSLKNYLILIILFLVTISITIYLCKCYYVYSDSMKEIPVIRGTLFEITSEELEHYVQENPNCTVYICTASDPKCRNFEEDFIKLIKKKELQDEIVYLNLSNANQDEFVDSFNNNYKYKVELTSIYPAIVMFENAEVTNILQENEGTLTITKAKQFIELNKIGE